MKTLAFTIIASAAILCPLAAYPQQTKILTADKHNEYGLVYTLPATALRIEVTATRRIEQAGPYFQYAKRYIGTDNVVKQDAEQWTIESVKVAPYGVPNLKERYLMQLKPGAMTYLCVDPDGMLRAINRRVDPSPAYAENEETPLSKYSGKEYLKFVSEDFLASQSSAKQAQMLAESLAEVRDAKIALTRGTAETMPTDGRQLELMLNSLAEQEETLAAAFAGRISTQTVKRVFTFEPQAEGNTILFRMSDFAGFVEPDNYAGDPVEINVKIKERPELPKDDKGEVKKLPKDAVIYTLPGTATVNITLKGRKLYSADMEMAQFGTVFGLAPGLFSSKKEPSSALFDAATGALLEIGKATE